MSIAKHNSRSSFLSANLQSGTVRCSVGERERRWTLAWGSLGFAELDDDSSQKTEFLLFCNGTTEFFIPPECGFSWKNTEGRIFKISTDWQNYWRVSQQNRRLLFVFQLESYIFPPSDTLDFSWKTRETVDFQLPFLIPRLMTILPRGGSNLALQKRG